jgi:hypothetical protein
MKVMTSAEFEQEFELTSDYLDALEKDTSEGILHGEPRGEVIVGHPMMFGEEMKQVGFKEPVSKIAAIDTRAKQLGMKRSDYLRYLVQSDLHLAGMA